MTSRSLAKNSIIYAILVLGAAFIIIPFLWMLLSSVKTAKELLQVPPTLLPENLALENYKEVFKLQGFKKYIFNSIFVTVCITLGELITTILAAFAFSKLNFKGNNIIFAVLLGTMMVPGEVLVIPNFVLLSKLSWINTYKALIIPWCTSVFSIFLLKQHFMSIPKELHFAAKIDGCKDFKFLWHILIPIARPTVITIGVLKIINSWNSFMWPMIVTNSEAMRTLPTALAKFSTESGSDYHLIMALSTLVILPMVIVYILLQKYILDGVKGSNLKG